MPMYKPSKIAVQRPLLASKWTRPPTSRFSTMSPKLMSSSVVAPATPAVPFMPLIQP